MTFTNEQLERHSRNMILSEVGVRGQKKLLSTKVLIIGVGGLGVPAVFYLAATDVGAIDTADADEVDLSSLQQQITRTTTDLGRAKTRSAKETMQATNPDVTTNSYRISVVADSVMKLIADYDSTLDGTDDFPAKFLINDACVLTREPFSHTGIIWPRGQLITYVPGQGPCYCYVSKELPSKDAAPVCSQTGIIGAIVGVIGPLQAMETVKYLVGAGGPLTGQLPTHNVPKMESREIKLSRVHNCVTCGERPTILESFDCEQAECDLKRRSD